MSKSEKLTTRDLLIVIYEGQQASKERDAKTQYLLLSILGAIIGRPLVGSPPLVIISFLTAVFSTIFAMLVLIRAWKVHGPIKYIMLIFLIGTSLSLAATLGIDGSLGSIIASLRIVLSFVVVYWAATLPTHKPKKIILED